MTQDDWKKFTPDQQELFRYAIHPLMQLEGANLAVEDDFFKGELEPAVQQEINDECIEFLNSKYGGSIENAFVDYFAERFKGDRDSYDTVADFVTDVTEAVQEYWLNFRDLLSGDLLKKVNDKLQEIIVELQRKEVEQQTYDRSPEAVCRALLQSIVPQLLVEQGNLILRLQGRQITSSEASELVALFKADATIYDLSNQYHRLLLAELLNVTAQQQRSIEDVVADHIVGIFLRKIPEPRSALDNLYISKSNTSNSIALFQSVATERPMLFYLHRGHKHYARRTQTKLIQQLFHTLDASVN